MRLTLKRSDTAAPTTLATKLAAGAFIFFLVKGLLWLIIPAALAIWAVK
ncbi:MAG: hypothetical protein ACKVS8_00250 [Phycisphaerales bacterium]